MADTTTEFYVTIATIVGVWVSVITSIILVLFTYITNQNTNYFTSLGKESNKIYLSAESVEKDLKTQFPRAISGDAKDKCIIALESISEQIKKNNKNVIKENISQIYETMVTKVIRCYPAPNELVRETLPEGISLIDNDEYNSWMENYNNQFSFNWVNKRFEEIETYFENITNELDSDTKSKVSNIKNAINNLRVIDKSLHKIKILNHNYKPVVTIFEVRKRTLINIVGVFLFGFCLPAYMLLPPQYHIGIIPEWVVICVIIIGLIVFCDFMRRDMNKIIKSILKK